MPALVVPGPFVPRPMGLLSVFQCRVDLPKASVVPWSLEPQGEVGSIWRSPVGGGQVEAEALLAPVSQRWQFQEGWGLQWRLPLLALASWPSSGSMSMLGHTDHLHSGTEGLVGCRSCSSPSLWWPLAVGAGSLLLGRPPCLGLGALPSCPGPHPVLGRPN